MAVSDAIRATGVVHLTMTRGDGSVEETTVENLVVRTGHEWLAQRMQGTNVAPMSHIALGSNGAQTTLDYSSLGREIDRRSLSQTSVQFRQVYYYCNFPRGVATGSIAEMGIFNAAGGGVMLARVTFPSPQNKTAADSLQVTWVITPTSG